MIAADSAAIAPSSQLQAAGRNASASTMNGTDAMICRGPVAVPPPHDTSDSPYDALNRISATNE